MSSNRKSEASRRNGAKSHGPKSAAGKEKSSANAIRHGLTSTRVAVLANENPAAWDTLHQENISRYRPEGGLEEELVVEITQSLWVMRRSRMIESSLLDMEMDLRDAALTRSLGDVDEGTRIADSFKSLSDRSRSLDLLLRYSARCRRNLERGLASLARAQESRRKPPQDPPGFQPAETPEIHPDPGQEIENKKMQNEPERSPRLPAGSFRGIAASLLLTLATLLSLAVPGGYRAQIAAPEAGAVALRFVLQNEPQHTRQTRPPDAKIEHKL